MKEFKRSLDQIRAPLNQLRMSPNIQVPQAFGGRAAAEKLVNAYVEFGRKFDTIEAAMKLIDRDMIKKAFDERTKRKYTDAIIATLEDEGVHHEHNGYGASEQ